MVSSLCILIFNECIIPHWPCFNHFMCNVPKWSDTLLKILQHFLLWLKSVSDFFWILCIEGLISKWRKLLPRRYFLLKHAHSCFKRIVLGMSVNVMSLSTLDKKPNGVGLPVFHQYWMQRNCYWLKLSVVCNHGKTTFTSSVFSIYCIFNCGTSNEICIYTEVAGQKD